MKKNAILIDCEKIKYPNTGLFSFTTQLMKAIETVKDEYAIAPTYLLTRKCLRYIPKVNYRIITLFDKLYFRVSDQFSVFHSTSQCGKYVPRKQKVLLTIHDLNFLYEKSPNKGERIREKVQKWIDRADHLVAISEFAKQDILNHMQTDNKPIDVIYNGCSFYEGEILKSAPYTPTRAFLFTVGTVLPKKNLHTLPALLVGNEYELIIAGNKSDYVNKILEKAKEYEVEDRVKILGPISEAEKDWYYRNCAAFVFPSIAEGFGLPVIEALHYGKPTFISLHTSLPEIGQDHCYYFDYDFDPIIMNEQLKSGMEHFKTREIQKLIDYAHSFSWENAARAYCEIYNKLSL